MELELDFSTVTSLEAMHLLLKEALINSLEAMHIWK